MPARKYLKVVSRLVRPGTIGMAVLLGSAASAAAHQEVIPQNPGAQQERVSERLAAIREAVSELSGPETAAPTGKRRMAWHNWGNGGGWRWGRPWGNFNFGLPWSNWNNGWQNWRNGWPNW